MATKNFDDSIIVDITDVDGIESVTIYADSISGTELVYASNAGGESVGAGTEGDAYNVIRSLITDGYRYTFTRTSGFKGTILGVTSVATDAVGDLSVNTVSFDITPGPETPVLQSVSVISPVLLELVFDVDMEQDTELSRVANYQVRGLTTPDLSISSLLVVNATTVRLTINEQRTGAGYEVVVSNVTDAAANPIVVGAGFNQVGFTGAGDAPVIELISPVDGAANADRGTEVLLQFTDATSGIEVTSIEVQIEGNDAIIAGEVQAAFRGPLYYVETLANGVRINLDPVTAFAFGQTININASVLDHAGNADL